MTDPTKPGPSDNNIPGRPDTWRRAYDQDFVDRHASDERKVEHRSGGAPSDAEIWPCMYCGYRGDRCTNTHEAEECIHYAEAEERPPSDEPTEEMKQAGIEASPMIPYPEMAKYATRNGRVSLDTEEVAAIYKAMRAVAPPSDAREAPRAWLYRNPAWPGNRWEITTDGPPFFEGAIVEPLYTHPARSGLEEAAENAVIAFGMGWDMEGVIDVLRKALPDRSRAASETQGGGE